MAGDQAEPARGGDGTPLPARAHIRRRGGTGSDPRTPRGGAVPMKYPRTQRDFDAEFAEREEKDYQRQYYTGCLPDVFRADLDVAMLFTLYYS